MIDPSFLAVAMTSPAGRCESGGDKDFVVAVQVPPEYS
jgi:hypothetical protein